MTLRSGQIRLEDRKRLLISFLLTLGLYCFAAVAVILVGLWLPKTVKMTNKTVIVNLVGPEASDPGLGSITVPDVNEDEPIVPPEPEPEAPKPTVTVPPAPKPAPKPTPAPPKPKPKPEPAPKKPTTTIPEAEAKPEPKPEATPVEQPPPVPVTTVTTVPLEPWVPGERPSGSRVTGTTTIKKDAKAERGNAMETTLGGAQGTVGQGLYVPIYLHMPLPLELPAEIHSKIPPQIVPPNTVLYSADARQRAFRSYYDLVGGVWKLKAPVALEQREPMWGILEDAGFDPVKADYKAGRNLAPVVVSFTVTKDRKLVNVEMLQSSGDPVIDESVVYGFRRASFWNKTGEQVTGKFTYRF